MLHPKSGHGARHITASSNMQSQGQNHGDNRNIFSVSELNDAVARLLETEFAWVWVEAEISNLARPSSGHLYFSLKDAGAQVRCAMFRSRNRELGFVPENGVQVLVRGKVSLYQPRGDYQLIVDRMEPAGAGLLQKKFDELKQRLAAEGLFSETHKRSVPALPACIGIITSRSGAAVRDVLSVIRRRFPSIPVKLYPVPVQGAESAPSICDALQLAARHGVCDVLLLVRGGGSLEDLWSFNEESVARAIHACPIPVVSGVGHEVDVTIADFVADFRAATPTAAAEKVTPDQHAWMQTLDAYQNRLRQLMAEKTGYRAERLAWLRGRLAQQHPVTVLQRLAQRLDDLQRRLHTSFGHTLDGAQHSLRHLRLRLAAQSPGMQLERRGDALLNASMRLHYAMRLILENRQSGLASLSHNLHVISPLTTLARGYSITTDDDGKTLADADKVQPDQRINTRLHRGQLVSRIEKIIKEPA
jgi:exodeoxyribonuclease VII large subunit